MGDLNRAVRLVLCNVSSGVVMSERAYGRLLDRCEMLQALLRECLETFQDLEEACSLDLHEQISKLEAALKEQQK